MTAPRDMTDAESSARRRSKLNVRQEEFMTEAKKIAIVLTVLAVVMWTLPAFAYDAVTLSGAKGIAVLADVNGDGIDEAVQVRASGKIFVHDGTGWTEEGFAGNKGVTRLDVGDFDGDGVEDVLMSSDTQAPRVFYGEIEPAAGVPGAVTISPFYGNSQADDYAITWSGGNDTGALTWEVHITDGVSFPLANILDPATDAALVCGLGSCTLNTPVTLTAGTWTVRVRGRNAFGPAVWAEREMVVQ